MALAPQQRTDLERELANLQRKADKRRDEPGFAANVKLLDARITALRAELEVENG